MKEVKNPSKIVDIGARLTTSGEPVGQLLETVRRIANQRLQQWIGNAFEHVDDALFDLAEKAENNAAQMHYFDGMRDVRKRRPLMERQFLAIINRELGELTHSKSTPPAAVPPGFAGHAELSLVADNELEESLAITSMISKNEARLARELFAVNQRLAVICGGRPFDETSNPLAPATLSQAFRQALHELKADLRVKLIIYKLFDRYLLASLEDLYQEINDALVQAGVLPQLPQRVARAPEAGGTGGAPSQADDERIARAVARTRAVEIPGDLLQTLHALLSARRAPDAVHSFSMGNEGGKPGASAEPPPSAHELLGALSVLQNQIASAQPFAQAAPDSGRDVTDLSRDVQQLKPQLLSQIDTLRGERATRVSSIDEDTIDLVGMLFEFVLADSNLPAQMQALLARLQIPYLKAAILDRKMFAHRQHPARRLLDSLAEQAKEWSDESDRDRRLYDKVKSIVEKLLHEFDDDLSLFERLMADLQQFSDIHKHRSELAEQRVAESTRGREKLELARRRVAREIVDRIEKHSLPPLVHGILARAWANHLVLVLLRQGEFSDAFRSGLRFVDEFIASTRPVIHPGQRDLLRQRLPAIERALRLGLANVAFQEQDVEQLIGQLRAYYRQQLGESDDAWSTGAPANDAARPTMLDTMQPLVQPDANGDSLDDQAPPMVVPDSPEWQQVLALRPGVWLEFSHLDPTITRAKLSWISPMTGRYLFVNRRGLKAADYAPEELAVLLADGKAAVLADSSLFDRALSSIVTRLAQPENSWTPAAR